VLVRRGSGLMIFDILVTAADDVCLHDWERSLGSRLQIYCLSSLGYFQSEEYRIWHKYTGMIIELKCVTH